MDDPKGFWGLWLAVTARPVWGLAALERAVSPLRAGLAALAVVMGTYSVILAVFLLRDYPAAGESVLPLTVDEQYAYQIWYQAPLFLAMTAALAWLLAKISKRGGSSSGSFAGSFAQVSFATAVPFALTTMLVEAVVAGAGARRPGHSRCRTRLADRAGRVVCHDLPAGGCAVGGRPALDHVAARDGCTLARVGGAGPRARSRLRPPDRAVHPLTSAIHASASSDHPGRASLVHRRESQGHRGDGARAPTDVEPELSSVQARG